MFAVMTLGSVAAALATAARASPSAPPAAFWLLGPIILITVYVVVRAISRHDDVFLRQFLIDVLEART
jgi:hypothetical protein